jgi:hypothetical protein
MASDAVYSTASVSAPRPPFLFSSLKVRGTVQSWGSGYGDPLTNRNVRDPLWSHLQKVWKLVELLTISDTKNGVDMAFLPAFAARYLVMLTLPLSFWFCALLLSFFFFLLCPLFPVTAYTDDWLTSIGTCNVQGLTSNQIGSFKSRSSEGCHAV